MCLLCTKQELLQGMDLGVELLICGTYVSSVLVDQTTLFSKVVVQFPHPLVVVYVLLVLRSSVTSESLTTSNFQSNVYESNSLGCSGRCLLNFHVYIQHMVCILVVQSCLTPRTHGLQPARLLCPRHSPGKNTGVSGLPCPSPGDPPNPGLPNCCQILYRLNYQGSKAHGDGINTISTSCDSVGWVMLGN